MFFITFEAVGNISDIISNWDQVASSNNHCYVSNTTSKPDLRGGAPASRYDLGTETPALRCDLGTKVPAPRYDFGSEAQDRITEAPIPRSYINAGISMPIGPPFQGHIAMPGLRPRFRGYIAMRDLESGAVRNELK